jgi:hypothetical protein
MHIAVRDGGRTYRPPANLVSLCLACWSDLVLRLAEYSVSKFEVRPGITKRDFEFLASTWCEFCQSHFCRCMGQGG